MSNGRPRVPLIKCTLHGVLIEHASIASWTVMDVDCLDFRVSQGMKFYKLLLYVHTYTIMHVFHWEMWYKSSCYRQTIYPPWTGCRNIISVNHILAYQLYSSTPFVTPYKYRLYIHIQLAFFLFFFFYLPLFTSIFSLASPNFLPFLLTFLHLSYHPNSRLALDYQSLISIQ